MNTGVPLKKKKKAGIIMTTMPDEKKQTKPNAVKKLLLLILVFTVVFVSIFVIRSIPKTESEFVDSIADQIEREMDNNQIVLSVKNGRRTVAEFKDPIILTHGKESRLIVHTAELSETVEISNEGLGGWAWTSSYQKIEYKGIAQYTVDLSQLAEEDFVVNNEQKTLTVQIPYAVLDPINIPANQIKVYDEEKGWAAAHITMTTKENNQLEIQAEEKMKAKLIDEDILAVANEDAKKVVAELLTATVQSVDPEFTVVVVQ